MTIKSSPGPDFTFERAAQAKNKGPVTGVDEAGRGPWAGPVVAAAVILNPECITPGLNDSKKLTQARREALFTALQEQVAIGVGFASVEEIDTLNILRASLLAMSRAVEALPLAPRWALIDGTHMPTLKCAGQTLVKGDGRSLSIAAASIIAKVTRDRLMRDLAAEFPDFGWERNKGYGTAAHIEALKTHGVTQHHRRSFKPIHKMLCEDSALTY